MSDFSQNLSPDSSNFCEFKYKYHKISQKLPSVSCHWHAETAVLYADCDRLIGSSYFLVSFYLPLASSFIHGARALKAKDHRESFVLFLNNAYCKWIPQFAARDFTVSHGAVTRHSAVTRQIKDCSCGAQCEWGQQHRGNSITTGSEGILQRVTNSINCFIKQE